MRIIVRKKNKYHAQKTVVNGIEFASKKEAKRWPQLQLMERAGVITRLQRQVPFCLVPAQKGGIRNERAVYYVADFVYELPSDPGVPIIEDAKGVRTREYKIKRKLMKLKGYEITEV